MESASPVDKGWSWACVLGGFVNFVCVTGSSRASGILFVEIEKTFPGNSSLSAAMFGLQMGSLSLTAVLYPLLSRKISDRQMAMFGGVCLALSYSLLSLATDLYYVVLVFGFLNGTGYALIYNSCNVVLGQYFSRRLSLASGLLYTGDSVGTLVFPQLLLPILTEYALRGTLLLWGGILLHIVAASALFRPVTFYERRRPRKLPEASSSGESKNYGVSIAGKPEDDITTISKRVDSNEPVYVVSQSYEAPSESLFGESGRAPPDKPGSYGNLAAESAIRSDSREHSLPTSDVIVIGGIPGETVHRMSIPNGVTNGEDTRSATSGCLTKSRCPLKCFKGNSRRFGLFLNPAFVLYLAGTTVAMCGYFDTFLFVPSHATEFHISPFNISLLITISGAVDLVTKVTVGWFATLNLIRRSTIIGVLLVFTSAVVSPCVSARSYPTEMTYVLFVAVVGGVFNALYPVALRDITGDDDFRTALSMVVASTGVTNLWLPSLFGAIKDSTESYAGSLHICGGLMSLGGALILVASLVDKRRHKVFSVTRD